MNSYNDAVNLFARLGSYDKDDPLGAVDEIEKELAKRDKKLQRALEMLLDAKAIAFRQVATDLTAAACALVGKAEEAQHLADTLSTARIEGDEAVINWSELGSVNRLEIIADGSGRLLVLYNHAIKSFSIQDDNRTLKIFVTPVDVPEEEDD